MEQKVYESLRDAFHEHFKDTGEKVWEIHVNWDSASKINSVKLTTSKNVYKKDD